MAMKQKNDLFAKAKMSTWTLEIQSCASQSALKDRKLGDKVAALIARHTGKATRATQKPIVAAHTPPKADSGAYASEASPPAATPAG